MQRGILALCRFFEDYKKNENKEVKIDDFLNAVEAKKAIVESMVIAKTCLITVATMACVSTHVAIALHALTKCTLFRLIPYRLPTLTCTFPNDQGQAAIRT